MKTILSVIIFIIISVSGIAQNTVGDWKDHFSWSNAKDITASKDYIFVACEQGIFSYNYSEIDDVKTKVNGLSDADIKIIKAIPGTNDVIIAYENSNIDYIKDNTVHNFSEIQRKQISGDKSINNIIIRDNTAWLSCGFGIVLLNLDDMEFSDTYYIGETGNFTTVEQTAFYNNYVYAATEEGLKRASLSTGNLFDFNNWEIVTLPQAGIVNAVCESNNKLYTNIFDQDKSSSMYRFSGSVWEVFNGHINEITKITKSDNYLFIFGYSTIGVFDNSGNFIKSLNKYNENGQEQNAAINSACEGNDGLLYFADRKITLVKENNNSTHEFISPVGPETNSIMNLEIFGNKIIGTAGGFKTLTLTNLNKEASYFIYNFDSEEYQNYSYNQHDDFYSVTAVDNNTDHLYLGTWNEGLFEIENGEIQAIYDETNSKLQSIMPNFQSVRIGGIHIDSDKNIWVSNSEVNKPISVLTPNGDWYSYKFASVPGRKNFLGITHTNDNNLWVASPRTGGILVFDHNDTPTKSSDDRSNFFIPKTSDGEESSDDVRCIEQDRDGTIWVGTAEGIFVYYNPEDAFESPFYADRIQLTSVGSDTSEQYLLKTEHITAIKVDGANRKWIGTLSAGVFVVSPNGKDQIHAFNSSNSPLLSNNITDIEIDHETGRVFIATSKGLLSYRAEATIGKDIFEDVYVFPNPVRPEYTGKIIVTGLVQDADVKITDVSGNLVFETTAMGGQAVWEGKDLNNRRVNTGVYLVFCSNEDGSQTHVTKLLFIN